jgi:hypothetical protein
MKILSFDVGIKNLAYCLFEVENEIYKIIDWNILNLCDLNYTCITCNKKAKFYKENKHYCTVHAKKNGLDQDFLNIKKQKKEDLIILLKKLNLPIDLKKKQDILDLLDENKNLYFSEIETTNASSLPLLDIGIAIRDKFDKQFLDIKIDKVLIENQISKIANRMKTIQGMIMEYFIIKNVNEVYFISSINKLKIIPNSEKTTYKERKTLAIEYCKTLLDNKENIEFFNKHKKKDDLADCFLQGIYYISTLNLGKIKQ